MSGVRISGIVAASLIAAVGAALFFLSGPYGPFIVAAYVFGLFVLGGMAALIIMGVRMLHLPTREGRDSEH